MQHKMESPGAILGKAVRDAAFGYATANNHYAELAKTVRPLIDISEFLAKKATDTYEKKLAEGLRAEAKKAKKAKK